ncbi:hypothetical protein [Arsenophonus endosymbiont of Aphis craccivora]|uniref:hypothetical protein n=1 Tax=Arsenophonus endosymbiont of Aphis craccivora TaxID=1231049 RepID=UPI0015DE5042|nr:hypothetical protein [Arsenophonus endosymbiont of Aphis craccivora]
MPWGPDVETNLAISSANHLKVRFIQQSRLLADITYKKKIFRLTILLWNGFLY